MIGFFRRLRVAMLLDKAYQLTASSRYEEALRCLEAAEKMGLPRYRGRYTKTADYARLLKVLIIPATFVSYPVALDGALGMAADASEIRSQFNRRDRDHGGDDRSWRRRFGRARSFGGDRVAES
jgi:hypothetical protein